MCAIFNLSSREPETKLFCIFGIVTILLGIPLLTGPNSPWVLFTIFGCNYDKQFFAVSQSEKQWDAVGKGSLSDNKKEILNSMNGDI